MELAQRKPVAEGSLSLSPQRDHFDLANLVGAGLTGHDDIPLHFADNRLVGVGRMSLHVSNGRLARPASVVNAGIHHQPYRPEQFRIEIAQFTVGIILIAAQFTSQFFGVKGPAFSVGRKRYQPAEEGQPF